MSMGYGKNHAIWRYLTRRREPLRIAVMCGQCDGGLVPVNSCTCGNTGGPESPHERYCGYEPCPSGCWWRLHPGAPGAPSDTIVQLWIEDPKRTSLKRFAGRFPAGPWAGVESQGGRDRKIFGHVRCWLRLRVTRDEWRLYWSAGQEGHCAAWYYQTPWGALWGARQLHRSRSRRNRVNYFEGGSAWPSGLLSVAIFLGLGAAGVIAAALLQLTGLA